MPNPKNNKNLSLTEKYKLKGAQQMTYAAYKALLIKRQKAFKLKIPPAVKFILGTPFIIIFCCGLVFIPYILYLILTSPAAPPPVDTVDITNGITR